MPAQRKCDLFVKNVRLVRPNRTSARRAGIAIDGGGLLTLPGLVDPHMHTGIDSPLAEDGVSESRAAVRGA